MQCGWQAKHLLAGVRVISDTFLGRWFAELSSLAFGASALTLGPLVQEESVSVHAVHVLLYALIPCRQVWLCTALGPKGCRNMDESRRGMGSRLISGRALVPRDFVPGLFNMYRSYRCWQIEPVSNCVPQRFVLKQLSASTDPALPHLEKRQA